MRRAIFLLFPLAAVLLVQCKKSSSPSSSNQAKLAPYDSLRFTSLSVTSLEADSAGTCLITVQIGVNDAAGPSDAFVIFHTSLGHFPNGLHTDTVMADGDRMASLPLLSDSVGLALVSAAVDAFSKDTTIRFTPALPDDMLCSANQYTGSASDTFNIGCSLYRNPERGKVTDPIKVFFSVTPATGGNGAPALIVPAFAYSIDGLAMASVYDPFQNTGNFMIVATTTADNGNALSKSVPLVIN